MAPFSISNKAHLNAAMRFASEAAQSLIAVERLTRRAQKHGAKRLAQESRHNARVSADALRFWLQTADEYAALGMAL